MKLHDPPLRYIHGLAGIILFAVAIPLDYQMYVDCLEDDPDCDTRWDMTWPPNIMFVAGVALLYYGPLRVMGARRLANMSLNPWEMWRRQKMLYDMWRSGRTSKTQNTKKAKYMMVSLVLILGGLVLSNTYHTLFGEMFVVGLLVAWLVGGFNFGGGGGGRDPYPPQGGGDDERTRERPSVPGVEWGR